MFIAMVLVAAIAAGVLINTAGMLQAQAMATGEESTELVSERIDTGSAVGIVADDGGSDSGELEEIRLGLSAAAGAGEINLDDTVVQALGPEGQVNLVYAESTSDAFDTNDIEDLEEDRFIAQDMDGEFVDPEDVILNDDNGQFTLVFNPEAEPFGTTDDAFGEGDEASLDIVSPSSATTSVELNAPDLFQHDGEAVRL
ncbi:Archaeal flagellin [Natrarchaeobaculum sulfurireducens]|uniref:Archaeal flagellin n=1 Tax=Natrarchaeobaculum sulfurireducens TaxID=2044521 RepID=A0A346PGW9_9EURY|nr:Archaeal flagellin [Natrarchaeobaculum sulfurireducens]